MAKTRHAPEPQKSKRQEEILSTPRFLVGIVLIVLGVLAATAIISFFFTGGADRSIFCLSFVELVTMPDLTAYNALGKIGAWYADMVVTNGIGIMSLCMPWLLVCGGLTVLGVASRGAFERHLFYSIGVAAWSAVVLGFLFSRLAGSIYPLLGGAYGHVVSQWLVSAIGSFGTFTILALMLLCFVSVKVSSVRTHIIDLLNKLRMPNMPEIKWEDIIPKEFRSDYQASTASDTSHLPTETPEERNESNNESDNGESDENNEESDDTYNTGGYTTEQPTAFPYPPTPEADQQWSKDEQDDRDEQMTEVLKPVMAESVKDSYELEITNALEEETVEQIHYHIDEKYDPTLDISDYRFPEISLLDERDKDDNMLNTEELQYNKERIVKTLENFQIKIDSIAATVGPTVTLYEIVPAPGIRISKVQSLENDIALSLAALGIRIIAPIPGKGTIGIEVPNSNPRTVSMRSVIKSKNFQSSKAELPIAIGKTIANETYVFDLAKTPHLLVAGATGQGKSVGLNAIITSILYKKHPAQVKFVLVDPKMVEFSIYKALEHHYLAKMPGESNPIITDVDRVKDTLQSLTTEMDDRYRLLEKASVRGIKEYNDKFTSRRLNPENGHRYLPYLIVIIDEFADLIMTAGKEVETPIARIAQKARAVGIHMILATQRPSTNIITGVIKANFPSRIAFKVASMIDSRTILDCPGAQSLIGRGDMLIKQSSDISPIRVQCAFVDTPEVEKVNEWISEQAGYATAYELPECVIPETGGALEEDGTPMRFDAKIREVAFMIVNTQTGSTSNIQRQFEVGFNRAGKIMDQLEKLGIVSPVHGSKPREVLVQSEEQLNAILSSRGL